MIDANRADYNRAKLDHDLIVAITTCWRCDGLAGASRTLPRHSRRVGLDTIVTCFG